MIEKGSNTKKWCRLRNHPLYCKRSISLVSWAKCRYGTRHMDLSTGPKRAVDGPSLSFTAAQQIWDAVLTLSDLLWFGLAEPFNCADLDTMWGPFTLPNVVNVSTRTIYGLFLPNLVSPCYHLWQIGNALKLMRSSFRRVFWADKV